MKIYPLLCLTFILRKCAAIHIDDITFSNCTSGSNCGDTTNTDIGTTYSTVNVNASNGLEAKNVNIGSLTTENVTNVDSTTANPRISTVVSTMNTVETTTDSNTKNHDNVVCKCDVTVSSCDINCCCDADCNRLYASSNYGHNRPKMYNSRYCYTKNFIQRNNTRFIFERLASNLFCIAYDNLPPIYGIKDASDIRDRKAFEDAKYATNPKKYSWDWNNSAIASEFNISSRYHIMDSLWKLQNNMVTLIELPQSGFTGECKLGKILKYLETSKWTCMQRNLSNSNVHLFGKAYDNFTVISSPRLFNFSYIIAKNTSCPENVCLPVRSFYCLDSSSLCNGTESPEQSCSNGDCRNVIKRVRYTLVLNGTCGIQSIEIRFELTNASQSFYQYFEVTFEWNHAMAGKTIISRNGGTGYIVGNPIITGIPVRNNTNNTITEYIKVDESNFYLTVPLRGYNGDCDLRRRYTVGFGEDIRLRCSVKLTTDKFSSESCMDLQNQTFKHLLDDLLENSTESFVAKTGDISRNEISNWTKILFDRIARNVVTGQIYDNRIRCSGLITSLNIDILYEYLPKLENLDNYKIAGVSVNFSEPIDVSWPKCIEANCNDVLKIELLSLVSFTDISTPSMYRYAGGPNLDITLPYDFFYPFTNAANSPNPTRLFVQSISVILSFNIFKLL